MIPIDGIQSSVLATPNVGEAARPAETTAAGEMFGEVLESAFVSANQRAQEAAAMSDAFAAGTRDDIHGTMLSLSKADIELRLVGSVRNKVIDAFYELWRMQI